MCFRKISMISCNHHDYIEIACLYNLPVTLQVEGGREVSGIALDTVYDENKKESIKLETNKAWELVELALVISLKANKKNPHFDFVEFK